LKFFGKISNYRNNKAIWNSYGYHAYSGAQKNGASSFNGLWAPNSAQINVISFLTLTLNLFESTF